MDVGSGGGVVPGEGDLDSSQLSQHFRKQSPELSLILGSILCVSFQL